jgi:hypothetical protein
MSDYYNPRRTKYLYEPGARTPFRLSRSKIDLFLECPRCFYLDRRLGVGRPPGFLFSLNSAVDALLKKEFDLHRATATPHPLMHAYGLRDVIPYAHEKMDVWRDSLRGGVEYIDPATNFNVTGGVDDIWVNAADELIVVDYKATAKNGEVNIDAEWQRGYKRQMEVYQWLLRKNKFAVSNTGYFVYVNGQTDRESFDGKLEFDVKLIPYEGNDAWVAPTLVAAKNCLGGALPNSASGCDYCNYREAASTVESEALPVGPSPKARKRTKPATVPKKSLFD